ncbi:uncharacterized protein LOC131210852 [Anopheles bellator]|uniref:uncharacterized protein LOC131210852 n=1 Tax=Anopheles bellator TaxID=139047 RepID=UPI0026489652|nr:uncharacterized protein LOC131210852 [Anopheles bellator]
MERARFGDVMAAILWISWLLLRADGRAVPHHRQRGEGVRRLHNVTLDSNFTAGSGSAGELLLDGCHVDHFEASLFELLGHTGSLTLHGGLIPRVTYASPSLDTLVVDATGLEEFDVDPATITLTSLRTLQISRNSLAMISPRIGLLVGLRRLDLSQNRLTHVELDPFARMPQLRDLDLSVNRILWVGVGTPGTRLPSVHNLWVSYNRLQTFEDFPGAFPALVSVRLIGNSWNCGWVDRARSDIMRHGITAFGADYDCPGERQGGLCCYVTEVGDVTGAQSSPEPVGELQATTNRTGESVGVRYGDVEIFL